MPVWETDARGNPVIPIGYPGGGVSADDYLKQAESAHGILPDSYVNLVCYSRGAEACLEYAKWRIENGQPINSITLLGPDFYKDVKVSNFGTVGDETLDDWADYLYEILEEDVNVLVIADQDSCCAIDAKDFKGPEKGGVYQWDYWNLTHYNDPSLNDPVNNNADLKRWVYDWMLNPNQNPHGDRVGGKSVWECQGGCPFP